MPGLWVLSEYRWGRTDRKSLEPTGQWALQDSSLSSPSTTDTLYQAKWLELQCYFPGAPSFCWQVIWKNRKVKCGQSESTHGLRVVSCSLTEKAVSYMARMLRNGKNAAVTEHTSPPSFPWFLGTWNSGLHKYTAGNFPTLSSPQREWHFKSSFRQHKKYVFIFI